MFKRPARKVHYQIVKLGNPDSSMSTGHVDMHAKCGDIDCSCAVFDENLDRNVVTWSFMVAGYVRNNCAQEGSFASREAASCFELGSYLVTTLLDVYAKCGIIRDARSVFDELCDIDLISRTAMIVGRTQKGCSEEALKLFMHKECAGVLPNDVTVATCKCVFSMFTHGSAYKALELFRQMRTGSVLPDAVTLVSVLSACASLSALQLVLAGLRKPWASFRKCQFNQMLVCLEHFLMDVDYIQDGRWNQVKQVRELMKQRGLMKTSDCSLMEIDGDHFSFSTVASLAEAMHRCHDVHGIALK
ncbi:hypothetical protein NC651_020172 [Populus alba x Populus x berolinensis]|nr:hypothetical protein NC651_020172 [Populus alba x Populus x berolinensis]